jgi:2-iminobutanoate/2-iminopropanoate deaminase
MSREIVFTTQAPAPGGAYSQAVVVGSLVFTAGVGPLDPQTKKVVGETIEQQTEQVIRNLEAILQAAGSGLHRLVKATVHLANLSRDFAGFNETYARLIPEPRPVRTTVGSTLSGILVEMDVVAERDAGWPSEG